MGRKQKIDYQELQSSILQIATAAVAANGTSALSTRKIAKEIGCAHGTIYNIFDNLDAIILSINGTSLDRLQEQLRSDVQNVEDPFQAVMQLARTYTTFCNGNYHLWSMLVNHKLAPGNTIPPGFQEKIDGLFCMVSDMVIPLVAGDKKKADRAARVLWAGLHGVCSLAMDGKLDATKSETADILADSLVRNYLHGLARKLR
jgi:AcrR family transcriptional regulator